MPRGQAFAEMDNIRDELAAYCESQGYLGRPDVPQRLIDLGAAFAWLKLNHDERPEVIH